ncbi:glutaredoxin-1-like isoform X2 [Neopsephotus bourkii]|uniref:glutaredoxin-1-like isoform X1 n=1 Tax=Neopsephotus bourkii TaxID=309878 RepID=UPI002AA56029|nr:glutaredoxin-1-like isoform X1 [Neopsephotus bourkii]XP_061220626.1 glutaredoxin-1-like isoform X2 [Neopsephotus bourkii]
MADKLVEDKIRCDKVTLFTERGCCYCRNAEEMFKQYNFVPGALEVVDITQRKDVQDYLQQRTGHRTERDDQELHPPHSDIQGLPEGNSWKFPSAGSDASSGQCSFFPCH